MRYRFFAALLILMVLTPGLASAQNCLNDVGPYLGTFDGVLDIEGEVEVEIGPFEETVDFEGTPDFTITFLDWVQIPGTTRYLGIGSMDFDGEIDIDDIGDEDFSESFDFDTEDELLLDIATGRVFTGDPLDIGDIGDVTFAAGFNGDSLDGELKIRGDVFDIGDGKADGDLDLERTTSIPLTAEGLLNDIICEVADLARNDANSDSILDAADYIESLRNGDLK